MKRTPAIVVALVVVIGIGIAVGYWLLPSAAGRPSPSATSSSGSAAESSALEGRDASRALARLTSDPESLIPEDQKSSVNIADAVPAGSTIRVKSDSWAEASRTSGTLVATLNSPGQAAATYLVSMAKEGGRWVVVGTLPVHQ